MQNVKETVAQVANTVTVGGFSITLMQIDTAISIAVGVMALITACYSIVWYRIKIKQARKDKENE